VPFGSISVSPTRAPGPGHASEASSRSTPAGTVNVVCTNGRGWPNWSMKVGAEPSVTSLRSSETWVVSARPCAVTVCVVAPVFVTWTVWSPDDPARPTIVTFAGSSSRLWPVGVPPSTDIAAWTAFSESTSPAPCSREGKPRSLAVLVRIRFTSAGAGVWPWWVPR
jgi:hypothetical protein